MKRLITIAAMVLLPLLGMSQVTPTVYMTAANNGTTQPMQDDGDGGMGLIVRTENDSTNQYLDGPYDRWMAITGSCVDPTILSITFESFDIDPRDTLFIYDGVGLPPNSTAKMTANNNHNPLGGISV